MSHPDDKKKKIRKRNHTNWRIFQQAAELMANVDIGAPEHEVSPHARLHAMPVEEEWSKRLVTIRNRLDNSRRRSDDMWNRAAGTGDEGARGR